MDEQQGHVEPEAWQRQLAPLAEFRFLLRSFLSFSEQRADALGITAQQYQMLQVIANCQDEVCSISHLAARLLLRHNSAVELVDRAERIGLVTRASDSSDLRRSMLQISEHGRTLLAQLVQEHSTYLQGECSAMCQALQRVAGQEFRQGLSEDLS